MFHNLYVHMDELVYTTTCIDYPLSSIIGLILISQKEDIVNGLCPCEGCELCFVLHYKYVTNKYVQVLTQECLQFPSMYNSSGSAMCFSKKIFNALYNVQKNVTHLMCQNWKKGYAFITGSSQVSFPIEEWIFLLILQEVRIWTCTKLL